MNSEIPTTGPVMTGHLQPPLPERGLAIRGDVLNTLQDSFWKVVYLRSGTGTGKTATASLFAARNPETAWFRLDRLDNGLHPFIIHLDMAIHQVLPEFRHTIGLYPLVDASDRILNDLLDGFLDAYNATRDADDNVPDLVLVFDDIQYVTAPLVFRFLRILALRAPDGLRLFFLGRSEALEQQVLNGLERIRILDDSDLYLHKTDIERVVGYSATSEDDTTVRLPLAVSAQRIFLQQHMDTDPAIPDGCANTVDPEACLSGVFDTLAPGLQAFVRRIRLFHTMTAEQCNALAGIGNAAILLDYLANNHYFVKTWRNGTYTFFHPFRDMLVRRFPPSDEELIEMAHVTADAGNLLAAGDYATVARRMDLLEDCLEQIGPEMLRNGGVLTLRAWLKTVGESAKNPATLLLQAKIDLLDGQSDRAHPRILRAIEGFRSADNGEALVEAMRYLLYLRRYDGLHEEDEEPAHRMLEEAARISPDAECMLLSDLFCCLSPVPTEGLTADRLSNRREEARVRGDDELAQLYDWILIGVHFRGGRFPKVVSSWEKARTLSADSLNRLGKTSLYYSVIRSLQIMDEWDRIQEMDMAFPTRPEEVYALIPDTWNTLLMRAIIRIHTLIREYRDATVSPGDPELRDLMERLEDLTRHITRNREQPDLFTSTIAAVREMHDVAIEGKDPASAAKTIRDQAPYCIEDVYLEALFQCATALLLQERTTEASGILETCFAQGDGAQRPSVSANTYALMSCAAFQNQQETAAEEYARRAVRLAAQGRMLSIFSRRSLFEPLVHFAVEENLEPAFIRQVVDRFDYKIKKVYVNCFGDFYAAPIKKPGEPMHFRTRKTRELLAFLLHNRRRAVTKSELATALFGDDSIRNSKLLDVTIYYLRSAFRAQELDNPVLFEHSGYSICDNQIESGIAQAAAAVLAFRRFPGQQTAEAVLEAVPDLYMKDINSDWAEIQRDLYAELVRMAQQTIDSADD